MNVCRNPRPPRRARGSSPHVALRRVSGMSALLLLLVCVVFVLPSVLSLGPEWHVVTDILVILILGERRGGRRRASQARARAGVGLTAGDRGARDRMVHAGRSPAAAPQAIDAGRIPRACVRRRHQCLRIGTCDRRPCIRRDRALPAAGTDLGRDVRRRSARIRPAHLPVIPERPAASPIGCISASSR